MRTELVKLKGVGGLSIRDGGGSGWLAEAGDEHWTFRLGNESGIADVHRTGPEGEQETMWVARTSELFGWIERAFSVEGIWSMLGTLLRPVSMDWVEAEGVWLARLPVLNDADRADAARAMARRPLDELIETPPFLVSPPLPAGLVLPLLRVGEGATFVAFDAPSCGFDARGGVIWTPQLPEPWRLLWVDLGTAARRLRDVGAPFLAELRAMDRAEVRAEHANWLQRRSRPASPKPPPAS